MNSALPATNALAASYTDRINSFAQQKAESSATSNEIKGAKTAVDNSKLLSGNAIYYSPALKIDPQTQIVIYIQRDPGTGDIIRQYPSQEVVKAYKQTLKEKLDNTSVYADVAGKDEKQPDTNKDTFGNEIVKTVDSTTTGNVSSGSNNVTQVATPNTVSATGTLTNQAITPIGSNNDELV